MPAQKVLLIGDLHAVPDELADCGALVQFILRLCREEDLHEVWWLGDQHHTHAVLRTEVLHWWKVAFKALKAEGVNSVCLVGNHDQAGAGIAAHAMMAYQGDPGVTVIDKPTSRYGVLLVPFIHDRDEFIRAVNDHLGPKKTLVCHQTFDGSRVENGFYAKDGIDPNALVVDTIISGHIHTPQEFGKVWYVGAPRWRSLSDANTDRHIWMVTLEYGRVIDRRSFSTYDVCSPIHHVEDTEESPAPQIVPDARIRWRVDIRGSAAWCRERAAYFRSVGAKVRVFETADLGGKVVRESDGIAKAFSKYLERFEPKYGTPPAVLRKLVEERFHV